MGVISVGVTTTPRRAEYSKLHSFADYVFNDENLKGIAYAKNQLLKQFKDSEYIFLFDDDTFPIKEGWKDYFIDLHKKTGEHHFLYMRDSLATPLLRENEGVGTFHACNGCFMFLTGEVIKKVGGFSLDYKRYGFEHAGYSQRIHKAGLTSSPYLSPLDCGEWIYSMDLDNYKDMGIEHKPTLKSKEILESLTYNSKIFAKDNGFKDII